jgi:UDP-N-acetylglucosamine--N-acetylmuramyl-(pentapeptide) pyrophosphoryl-undecaprenol N-acetylglucosamine transferase
MPATLPTIALAAGGTGGHLFPAEALARELIARGHGVVLYTERRGAQYAQALAGIEHVVLPARSLAGGIGGKLAAALTIARAVSRARRSLGLPLLLHEQATRLSLANRQLLRLAHGLASSFPQIAGVDGFDSARITVTGNPVRRAILDARAAYPAFDTDAPLRLLVVGGSQSARVFGEVVPPALLALPEHLRRRLHLSLQYKGDDSDAIAARLREASIAAELRPFFDDMGARLRDTHLVITRAGASTAADLLTVGRPAIFVPIPQGGSREEQQRNAQTLAEAGVGWWTPEPGFTADWLRERLETLFASPDALPRAAAAAHALAQPDAAANLADLVERMLPAPHS